MKILVTGGAGFIGSHFIRHMLERHPGSSIVNLDLLTYAGQEANISDLTGKPGYVFVRGDVADQAAVAQVMSGGFDAVVHFAAESHVDRSIHGPDPFVHTNLVGTHRLVEEARRVGIRRFVQISSDEVYGAISAPHAAGPDTPLEPSNAYAASKAGADLLVAAAHRTHRFPAIITRCTNNYGPGQHLEKFIPLLITRALAGGELPIYGDGRQVRDWIHVEDHCAALAAILTAGVPGRVYTIAGGCALANLEVAHQVLKLAGRDGARIRHVQDRPGHDRRYALDDSVTRRELGWAPTVSFKEGLRRAVTWYRQRQDVRPPMTRSQPARRAGVGLA